MPLSTLHGGYYWLRSKGDQEWRTKSASMVAYGASSSLLDGAGNLPPILHPTAAKLIHRHDGMCHPKILFSSCCEKPCQRVANLQLRGAGQDLSEIFMSNTPCG